MAVCLPARGGPGPSNRDLAHFRSRTPIRSRTRERHPSPQYLFSSTLIAEVILKITTVNPKGQVTIPELLRDRYGFPPGTKVVWLERDGDLIPKPLLSVEQLRGRFKGGELTTMLLEERARDRKRKDG